MTVDRTQAVVVDTSVVSLIRKQDRRAPYYRDRLEGRRAVISFQTLEEAWFGAFSADWGQRRTNAMQRDLDRYEVVWPDASLIEVCARLRGERRATGRELGMADAWIAATALRLGCPLAAHDGDFEGIPGLELIRNPDM